MKGDRTTTDGQPPDLGFEDKGAPKPINPATGQHGAYWVLSKEERAKGFKRPVRRAYTHVGARPKHPTRELTDDEKERYKDVEYVVFEPYPEGTGKVGTYWTQSRLDSGCGASTKMGEALCETYARDPSFYGSTFCTQCRSHYPVSEFTWDADGEVVGS